MNQELPKSPWARRARFAKAVALARKGDFRSAELIYRAEAQYLLSTDRKQHMAGIYLEFADACFKPLKEEQKPDYAKALEFYRKAMETIATGQSGERDGELASDEQKMRIELLIGQCLQNLGKPGEAAPVFEKFIKDYPGSAAETSGVTVQFPDWAHKAWNRQRPLNIEARYRLGQCRLAEGNAREARRVWQDLLAKFVDVQSPWISDAQFDLRGPGISPTRATRSN